MLVLRQEYLNTLQIAEMKFLRAIQGYSRLDRVNKDDVRTSLEVEEHKIIARYYKTERRDNVMRLYSDKIGRKVMGYGLTTETALMKLETNRSGTSKGSRL